MGVWDSKRRLTERDERLMGLFFRFLWIGRDVDGKNNGTDWVVCMGVVDFSLSLRRGSKCSMLLRDRKKWQL